MDTSKFSIMAFGSVLGTGGFALASKSFLPFIVLPLTLILVFFFFLFSAIFLVKIIRHPKKVKAEINHTLSGNFYAFQPISAVILAILCWNILPTIVSFILLAYGATVIFILSLYLSYHFFANINVKPNQLHGGWFITPVASILVTNAVLMYHTNAIFMIIGLTFFGIGAMLFILILGMLFFRLVNHSLPPLELAPTNYIILAPIGILIADFIKISSYAGTLFHVNLVPSGIILGIMFWGFGIWAIGVNLLLLNKYLRSGLKFHMGWWSYVFPTAAFTLGTIALSSVFSPFKAISIILYVSLIAIFAIVLTGSVMQAFNGFTRQNNNM